MLPWPLPSLAGYTVSQRSLHIMGWVSHFCNNLPLTPTGPMCQWGSTWEFPHGTPLGKSNWLWEGHVSSPYMLPIGCTPIVLTYDISMELGLMEFNGWYWQGDQLIHKCWSHPGERKWFFTLGDKCKEPVTQRAWWSATPTGSREVRSPQQVMGARGWFGSVELILLPSVFIFFH